MADNASNYVSDLSQALLLNCREYDETGHRGGPPSGPAKEKVQADPKEWVLRSRRQTNCISV